jgi:polysaccharide biosynthesis transport protein
VIELAWKIWGRRKWLAVPAFVLPLAALVGLVTSLPNLYRATAIVLVERQTVPESYVRSTVTSELETRLFAVSQEIFSRARLEALIAEFGLYPGLRERGSTEAVVKRMRNDINLELKGGSSRRGSAGTLAFALGFQGTDPDTVARVTNRLVGFFIDENLRARERQAAGTEKFIQLQLQTTKQRLAEQEQQLTDFKKRYPGELPQHTESNLGMLERLNAQLRLNSENLTRALARRETVLREPMAMLAPGVPGGVGAVAPTGPGAALVRLYQLKQELLELRTRFSDKYPDVVRVKEEIALLQAELARTDGERTESTAPGRPAPGLSAPGAPPGGSSAGLSASGQSSAGQSTSGRSSPGGSSPGRSSEGQAETPNPLERQRREALTAVDTEIKILQGEETSLRAALAEYRRRVENAPRREQEFLQLSRDYETTNELYKTLVKRYDEAQIAGRLEARQEGEHFRSLEPAMPPEEPAGPKRGLLLLASLVVSLGLSVATVVLAERLDGSFHTLADLRTFSRVPVFSIPRIVTAADEQRRRRQFWLATAGATFAASLIFWTCHVLARGSEQLLSLLPGGRL